MKDILKALEKSVFLFLIHFQNHSLRWLIQKNRVYKGSEDMYINELSNGDYVYISVEKRVKFMTYRAQVFKTLDEGIFLSDFSGSEPFPSVLDDEDIVSVGLSGYDGYMYWEDVRHGMSLKDGEWFMFISNDFEGETRNRREFFRVFVDEDVTLFDSGQVYDVSLTDVSEGGMSFVTEAELEINSSVEIEIPHEGKYITVMVQPIRKEELGSDFSYGCMILGEIKDEVVDFVMDRQRKQIRREKSIH